MTRAAEVEAPEAVIVAGGLGTRLRPLTTRRPKPLLEVAGVPFVEHQIARLQLAGVRRVVLATAYRAELFESVLGDGSRWGVDLRFVREEEPLGTGGAVRNAAAALTGGPDSAVVVLNGDVLSGHDLPAQVADFQRPRAGRGVEVSLHLVEVDDARAFGCVSTDPSGRVTGFWEKTQHPVTNQVNAGCYVFRRRVIEEIAPGRVVSVERETFPGLVDADRVVVAHQESAYWRDVGTPSALVAASRDLVLGVGSSPAVDAEPGGARIGATADVAGSAVVNGGSAVSESAVVGERATVRGCVVMAGARVAADAVVVDSVLAPGALVGEGAALRSAAVGDGARIGAGVTLAPGRRVECDEVVG